MSMTICWPAHTINGSVLNVVTDSQVQGAVTLPQCQKLFALPRGDCFMAYTGERSTGYTAFVQLYQALASSVPGQETYQDISELKGQLMRMVDAANRAANGALTAHLQFIFGGYSWRSGELLVWRVVVDPHQEDAFVAIKRELRERQFVVAGSAADQAVVRQAMQMLRSSITEAEWGTEPLGLLRDQLLHHGLANSAGALQYLRVLRNQIVEAPAMLWPDTHGYWRPYLNGRLLGEAENFAQSLYDPRRERIVSVPYHKNSVKTNPTFYEDLQPQ